MKEKIAIVFGTFAPLHQGHIDLIQKAKRSYDKVRVVVSGYEGDRGQEGVYLCRNDSAIRGRLSQMMN